VTGVHLGLPVGIVVDAVWNQRLARGIKQAPTPENALCGHP
jgi:hypothetical protein